VNESHQSSSSESVHVELTDVERNLLWQGLGQWGGPAALTDALAVAMRFESEADFFVTADTLSALLLQKAPLAPAD